MFLAIVQGAMVWPLGKKVFGHCCSRPKVEWKIWGEGDEKSSSGNAALVSPMGCCCGIDDPATAPSVRTAFSSNVVKCMPGDV